MTSTSNKKFKQMLGSTQKALAQGKTKVFTTLRGMRNALTRKTIVDSTFRLDFVEQNLLNIFKSLEIDVIGDSSQGSLELLRAMNDYAQKNWLRKQNTERWEMTDDEAMQTKMGKIVPFLKQLGFVDTVWPQSSDNQADVTLILGATVMSMKLRTEFLLNAIVKKGFNPGKIFFLTGDRQLNSSIETFDSFAHASAEMPKTESEAAKFIWENLCNIDNLDITFLNTERQENRRPNTVDTVCTFLLHFVPDFKKEEALRLVAVSNNPYIPYQRETIKACLMQKELLSTGALKPCLFANFITIGPEITGQAEPRAGIMLDCLARYMYSLLETQKIIADDDSIWS